MERRTIRIRLRSTARWHEFLGPPSAAEAWREPGLLRVNKSIRIEASSVYFGLKDFSVSVYPYDMESAAQWLESIIARCSNNPFQRFHFFVTTLRFRWADLYSMLPLVHVLATTGLELNPGSQVPLEESPYSGLKYRHFGSPPPQMPLPLFVMSYDHNDRRHDALQEAVDMGIQAHEEGWRSDAVDFKFDEWFDEKIEKYLDRLKRRRPERAGGNYQLRDSTMQQRAQRALEAA